MSLVTESTLWQVQASASSGSQSVAGNNNTIRFNANPVTATGGFIYRTEVTLRNSSPENTSLQGGTNDIEDMGPDGVDIQLTGEFKNVDADLAKLVRFWRQPKTVTGYTKGRFGLNLADPDTFDVVPTSTYGYHIVNPRIIIDYEMRKIFGFVVTLRLSGDVPTALT